MTPADRVRALSLWRGPVEPEPLKGGLSNLSFVVRDAGTRFVVRLGEDIPVHHVFRDREHAASQAAFEAGLSPEPVHREAGLSVFRFIEGRTFEEADFSRHLVRVVGLLRRCHADVGRRVRGPINAFWAFHVVRDYAGLLGLDAEYGPIADRLEAMQIAMPTVLAHNDLLPGNLIDDGARLWLIDWEYAGFGSPLFDLANVAANGALGPADDL